MTVFLQGLCGMWCGGGGGCSLLMVVTNCSLTGFFLPHTHSAEPSPPPCSHQQMKLTNEPRDCSTSPQSEPQPQVTVLGLDHLEGPCHPRENCQTLSSAPQLAAAGPRKEEGTSNWDPEGSCLRVEESPQGEKHLVSLVWQGPAAACQPGSSGLCLVSFCPLHLLSWTPPSAWSDVWLLHKLFLLPGSHIIWP